MGAEVELATLLGVLAFPVSSNSTVKLKVPGVTLEEIGFAESLAVAEPVVVKAEQSVPIPVSPAGIELIPVLTHHS